MKILKALLPFMIGYFQVMMLLLGIFLLVRGFWYFSIPIWFISTYITKSYIELIGRRE